MKRNTRVSRGKVLAQAFTATVATALLLVSGTSAFADAARTATASAFGLEATGLLAIQKTPEVTVTSPPGDKQERRVTLPLNAGTLAINATIFAVAEAKEASDIHPLLLASRPGNTENVTEDNVNARGFASTEAIDVVVSASELLPEVVRTSLVTADAIEAEAVAKCVNNQPVFETGYNILDLRVANIDLGTPLEGILNTVLNLASPGGLLSIVVEITRGAVTRTPESIAIDALRIRIPLLNETINISHAEARMPANCGVAAPAPGPQLAVTGGGGVVSFAGAGVLAAAVLAIVFLRRWRPEV